MFTTKPTSPASLPILKTSLIKYYALLRYTSTIHISLPSSIPASPSILYLFFHHIIFKPVYNSYERRLVFETPDTGAVGRQWRSP